MSTYNICFCGEIWKKNMITFWGAKNALSVAMTSLEFIVYSAFAKLIM